MRIRGWFIPLLGIAGCAHGSDPTTRQDGTGGDSTLGSGGSLGTGGSVGIGGGGIGVSGCTADCSDFPTAPLTDGNPPGNASTLFGDPASGGGNGPCLIEPQDGSLVPMNWLRPRFRWNAAAGENLFEVRLQTSVEANDLVAYTTNTVWTLPEDVWRGVAAHAAGQKITVIVRGINSASPGTPTRTQATLEIAPVEAGGSMVYWATTGPSEGDATSKLVGFKVGEAGTVDALHVSQAAQAGLVAENGALKVARAGSAAGRVSCIGCHTSTPDGNAVAFNDGYPWDGITASIVQGSVGQVPTWVTPVGAKIIQEPWVGPFSFSKGDWDRGNHIAVATYGLPAPAVGWDGNQHNIVPTTRLAWFDLSAAGTVADSAPQLEPDVTALAGKAFGFLERTGDTRAAANPDWSHAGDKIVYTSTEEEAGGHLGSPPDKPANYGPVRKTTESNLYIVPFGNRQGGAAAPIQGASIAGKAEYYPDFSADDTYVAFTRVDNITGYFYYRPEGEIYIVPAAGGDAIRLAANDPPACSGQHSPGIINSWPKWSPSVQDAGGKKYYWLIFSSARQFPEQKDLPPDPMFWSPSDRRESQLYMAPIVVEGSKVTTYPAVYLWNQTKDTSNLTPAWDEFNIPPAVVN